MQNYIEDRDKIGETKMLSWIKKIVALDLKHELEILDSVSFLVDWGRRKSSCLVNTLVDKHKG